MPCLQVKGVAPRMPTILQDKTFFRSGVQELEAYLLSEELFWPLTGSEALPRLTLGGLLLAEKRLDVRPLPARTRQEFSGFVEQLKSTRSRWRAAWERKTIREVRPRFVQWRNYLEEYRQAPDALAGDYPEQVHARVVLHLLGMELSQLPSEYTPLRALDDLLQAYFMPGRFAWDSDLAPAFPPAPYWFLYGKLKSS